MRSILIPGLMLTLGSLNWKLPERLDGVLPHLNVEGQRDDPSTHGDPESSVTPRAAAEHA